MLEPHEAMNFYKQHPRDFNNEGEKFLYYDKEMKEFFLSWFDQEHLFLYEKEKLTRKYKDKF